MGVTVISYTIKSITDQVGYLASLGMAQSAHVKSNALIGQVTIWGFNIKSINGSESPVEDKKIKCPQC